VSASEAAAHAEAARERLRAAGIDPARLRDAFAARSSTWGGDPAVEAALVHLAAESDEDGLGDVLAELVSRTPAREVRRDIKRALYRLTQRGRWSATAAPPPSTAALMGSTENEPEAWLSSIDPTGTRLLWLSRRTPDGVTSASAIASEDVGLREFHAGQTTRKALRQAQRDLTKRTGIPLVDAPWAHVHRLVRSAWDRTVDRTRLGDVPTALRLIAPRPPDAVSHPVDALVDRAAVAADESALAHSATALAEPELTAWLLPFEWVETAAAQVREKVESVLVVSPTQERERREEALARAVDDLFADPARRERFAGRLEETAYLLARRGSGAAARSAVAAAIAARGGRPIAEIPLLAELARRSVALALEAGEERAREEARSSLVVTPAQAIAEERQRQQRLRRR
jgi:hypothetical protein